MQEHSFDALAASQVLLTEPSISRSSLCEILQVYLRGDETVCVGLHQHGEATVLHSILPEPVTQILTAYVRQEIPNALFTTIVVSKNVGLPVHRDTSNGKHPVHLLAISEFQGGGIWIEHPAGNCYKDFAGRRLTGQVLNFSEYKLSFQADQLLHCTQPWSGQRLVLAAFCVSRFANTAAMRQLVDLGFVPPLATGGLCPSASVQPSRPLILELFAGTGRVSAALKIIGYEAVAVDHVKHPRAAHRIQIADLVTPEGVELVKSWLALPNCIGFFAAPPCGTCDDLPSRWIRPYFLQSPILTKLCFVRFLHVFLLRTQFFMCCMFLLWCTTFGVTDFHVMLLDFLLASFCFEFTLFEIRMRLQDEIDMSSVQRAYQFSSVQMFTCDRFAASIKSCCLSG